MKRLLFALAAGSILSFGYISATRALSLLPCPDDVSPREIEVVSGVGLEPYVSADQRACLVITEDGHQAEVVPCDATAHRASKWVRIE